MPFMKKEWGQTEAPLFLLDPFELITSFLRFSSPLSSSELLSWSPFLFTSFTRFLYTPSPFQIQAEQSV